MPEPPAPIYRPLTEADVPVTAYIRKAALEGLGREQGRIPQPWQPSLGGHSGHLVRTDPAGSWAAEIDGLVVGFAQSFVRGEIWFLAQLFVQPEVHTRGIGRELLRLAQDYGRRRGARVFAVVASSSPVAQALYMRSGMFGIGTGYRVTGAVSALLALPEPKANRKRVVDCSGWLDRIAEIDRELFGAERRQDHEYYLRPGPVDHHSFGLTRDGVLEGYGYVDARGWIGPIAASEPDGQRPLLRMAAEYLAGRGVEEASIWVASLNHVMMSSLLEAGWKSQPVTYFMSSEPFGRFDRYQPSGGFLL
ncbi:MAG: GNAT family N-acetyltransferase [Dehalococcoidia bacterium]